MDQSPDVAPTLATAPAAEPAPAHPAPRWGPIVLVAFVALVICTNVANGVWPAWVDDNPEGLLALSSRNRYLTLTVASGVSVLAYVVIGTLRIAAAFVVCHLIGRAYRAQALSWFTRYLGVTREALDSFDRGFHKAQLILIPFFAGSNIVAVLTGVHRTPPAKLAALLAIGIAGRLALFWWLANVFDEPLVDVLEFVQRYQWWAIAVSVLLVVLVNARNFRRGRGG